MSNKTLKENAKKTKSGPSLKGVILIALVTGIVLSLLTSITFERSNKVAAPAAQTDSCLQTIDGCYGIERRDTYSGRAKGLSDRDNLPNKTAMLFVFDEPSQQCFWMKDMRFNIDMIWLDEQKKIIAIKQDVSPGTYPESFCQDSTKYVLELNANDTKKLKFNVGQQLTF